jgi:hypothetical protein
MFGRKYWAQCIGKKKIEQSGISKLRLRSGWHTWKKKIKNLSNVRKRLIA